MPIPLILAGLGIGAAVLGAGGHLSAKETNQKAQQRAEEAQALYNEAKKSLELVQGETEEALLKLGYAKKEVLETSIKQFLAAYEKVKHITFNESLGINEISNFTIDEQAALQLQELTNIYSSSIKSGTAGAAAGTILALAANGSLSLAAGGLATAGTALLAGEIGAAASLAGTTLATAFSVTPLAAIAAPVILFTGISADMKADKNLEKANVMYAEAEAACEKMKISETLCQAITKRSDMFYDLLSELNTMFSQTTLLLTYIIQSKEGVLIKKKLSSSDFTENELKVIAFSRSLAGAVKAVLDTPMLTKKGELSPAAIKKYNETRQALPAFEKDYQNIAAANYAINPRRTAQIKAGKSASGPAVLSSARTLFVMALGIFLATMYAGDFASAIFNKFSRLLNYDHDLPQFLNSEYFYPLDVLSFWLLISTNIFIIFGRVYIPTVKKWCGISAGLGLFILFPQFCIITEMSKHYILVPLVLAAVLAIILGFFDERKASLPPAEFLTNETGVIIFQIILFWIYLFFSGFIGFSKGFCMGVVLILAFLLSIVVFVVPEENKQ